MTDGVGRPLEVISADSHVIEPPDLWAEELPARLAADVHLALPASNFEEHPGAGRVVDRLVAAERDGVAAEVLYPTLALQMFAIRDVALQQACFRVYNDWLIDYCRAAPDRLVGIPALCAYDIDAAIAELDRCRSAGLQGALLWMVPDPTLPYSSDHYERFWAHAAATDTTVSFHILSGFDHTVTLRLLMADPLLLSKASSNEKIRGVADTLFDLVFSGVLERHPGLRIVMGETDAGWLPFYTLRWDYYFGYHTTRGTALPITRRPSDLIDESVYVTFVDDPVAGTLLERYGRERWMWSSDFPHPASTWPNSQAKITAVLGHLAGETKERVVSSNVRTLYRFDG